MTDLSEEAKKVLKSDSRLTIEQAGLLVSETKRLRHVNGQLSGGKGNMKRERDDYKGRYYRMLEGVANLRDYVAYLHDLGQKRVFSDILDRIHAVESQPDGPVTPEEKRLLFGVENRARRQEDANFELGKEIAGMIRRGGVDAESILSYLEAKGLCDESHTMR